MHKMNTSSQPKKLDKIDKYILRLLQSNAKMSNAELAECVGLSPTPCHSDTGSTCFAGHTLVRIYSDKNIAQRHKRIEEIKVGDTVWSAPENGLGDEVRKRVTNIFKHEQQAVWLSVKEVY